MVKETNLIIETPQAVDTITKIDYSFFNHFMDSIASLSSISLANKLENLNPNTSDNDSNMIQYSKFIERTLCYSQNNNIIGSIELYKVNLTGDFNPEFVCVFEPMPFYSGGDYVEILTFNNQLTKFTGHSYFARKRCEFQINFLKTHATDHYDIIVTSDLYLSVFYNEAKHILHQTSDSLYTSFSLATTFDSHNFKTTDYFERNEFDIKCSDTITVLHKTKSINYETNSRDSTEQHLKYIWNDSLFQFISTSSL